MKSKYKETILDNLDLISSWISKGLLNNEIIEKLGISEATFYKYKKEHKEFDEIITRTREIATDEVEGALYSSCIGKKVKVIKPIKVKKKTYENGKVVAEEETVVDAYEEVYIPPVVEAQKFWLKNQRPKVWKDKIDSDTGQAQIQPVFNFNFKDTSANDGTNG